MTTKDHARRLHADFQTNADGFDPAKMMQCLTLQGVKFVRIQFRTLIFEDPAQLERLLRTTPELGEAFICLTRDQL